MDVVKGVVSRLLELRQRDPTRFRLYLAAFAMGLWVFGPRLNRWIVAPKDVSGKTVLITGAASGLGRGLCFKFAAAGKCKIVAWDINEEALVSLKKDLDSGFDNGTSVHTFKVDLCSREQIYEVAKKVKKDVGDVDILVNNAGIVSGKPFLQCEDSQIERTMGVNVMAHFWTCKAFLQSMWDQNSGHIVTVASNAGTLGVNKLADYCASKFAAIGFDESLRIELKQAGKTGVKTSMIAPFYIKTGMFDGVKSRILPLLEPDDVVEAIFDAILYDEPTVFLPFFVRFLPLFRALLPTHWFDAVNNFIGVNRTMDDFTGRLK